ncbi:MAG: phosphoenolpyruvate synthase [Candidatus Bathyarchaeia archaeon]|jgi:pyruvate,water dikinase
MGSFLLWFDEISKQDVPLVGGKSASLGEMTSKTKLPIPYGFALTADAYRLFLAKNGLEDKIANALKGLKDTNDTITLQKVGAEIRGMIGSAVMPTELERVIAEGYEKLAEREKVKNPFVAIRSSATAEDLPDASFAGQQESYLNVTGVGNVIKSVKECYASLFTDRAIFYRVQKGFNHADVALSAIVQMMCYSESSGVMFTMDPTNGDESLILIEASYGLGEYVVKGSVTPDDYYVDKGSLKIIRKEIPTKTIMLVRNKTGGTEEKKIPENLKDRQVITDEGVIELAKYALTIEQHYGHAMDIEWGLDTQTGKLLILQARPETVWSLKKSPIKKPTPLVAAEKKIILKGLPSSPGLGAGKAHVIMTVDGVSEFQNGEVLVTEMTTPDWVPTMKKSRAIVTDTGGMTCHAAIVSRELGIPCITGTKIGTHTIHTGEEVTVDAKMGVVYEGIVLETSELDTKPQPVADGLAAFKDPTVTGTKIFVNLGEPELANRISQLPVDGVGLLRMEFIVSDHVKKHPMMLIEQKHPEEFVDKLSTGLETICRAFYPRPVILRFSDFKTNEYAKLEGGEKYEGAIKEANPLIGWRGASRYTDPRFEPAFRLEIAAVKKVRNEMGMTNLWCMIPFNRTVDEFVKIRELLRQEGLVQSEDFKLWIMAEIPSNIILADEFCKAGADGFSIGSNDLTMLILGADRDNEVLAPLFDERNLAVKRAIKELIETAHTYGKTVSICGQAPSVYPEFAKFLVESGIDSISVNPDVIVHTRRMVAQVEQRVVLDAARKQCAEKNR